PARDTGHLDIGQATGSRLGESTGHGIEAGGQRVHAVHGEGNALGEAARPREPRTLGDPARATLGARAASVRGLAGHQPSHQARAHPAPGLADDAGVLVTENERGFPGKQTLRGVNVGAADSRGVNGDRDLARPRDGNWYIVDGEAALAAPGRDPHSDGGLTSWDGSPGRA